MFILGVRITSNSPTKATSQMLEYIGFKLEKKVKDQYSNLRGEVKPKSWEQFLTLFLEEFSTEDHQNTIAKLYLSRQRKVTNSSPIFLDTISI